MVRLDLGNATGRLIRLPSFLPVASSSIENTLLISISDVCIESQSTDLAHTKGIGNQSPPFFSPSSHHHPPRSGLIPPKCHIKLVCSYRLLAAS